MALVPRASSLATGLVLLAIGGSAAAASFTIRLGSATTPNSATGDPGDGPTDARWIRYADGRTEIFGDSNFITPEFNSNLTVRLQPDYNARSALEFNLGRLPDYLRVQSALLRLTTGNINVQSSFNAGFVRHLDSSRAVGNPGATWTYDELGSAPIVANLGPAPSAPVLNTAFDVSAAVRADHAADRAYSPFALAEDPNRGFRAIVNYNSEDALITDSRPLLAVEMEIPNPLSILLEPLGGSRFRKTFTLFNEVTKPLELIDLEFDPALYAEDSLGIVSAAPLANDWDQFLLGSAIDVPAVFTLAALRGGVGLGGSVSGFAVEFDWLGAGLPTSQAFSVFDRSSFELLYSSTAEAQVVPAPAAAWLLLTGVAGLAGWHRVRRRGRGGDQPARVAGES